MDLTTKELLLMYGLILVSDHYDELDLCTEEDGEIFTKLQMQVYGITKESTPEYLKQCEKEQQEAAECLLEEVKQQLAQSIMAQDATKAGDVAKAAFNFMEKLPANDEANTLNFKQGEKLVINQQLDNLKNIKGETLNICLKPGDEVIFQEELYKFKTHGSNEVECGISVTLGRDNSFIDKSLEKLILTTTQVETKGGNEMPNYEQKAIEFAEKYGIVDFTVEGNQMYYSENVSGEGVYKSKVNLDTMKETRKLEE